MKKRIVSIALALCLCLSSQSVAYAGQEEPVPEGNVFTDESQIRLAAADVEIPTPTQVYESMIALKEQDAYKEGTPWTNECPYPNADGDYHWKGGPLDGYNISAVGCVAFTFILSDAAFGSLPARMYAAGGFQYEDIKPGDILRVSNDAHTVIVLEVNEAGVIVAEGNISTGDHKGKVHWGRAISKGEVMSNTSHYITRYPEGYVSPDDPEADKIIGEESLGQLSWKLTKAGTLTISGNGAMPDFSSAEEHPWKENSSKIRKVVIEPGVTSIGDGVFLNSSVLSVEIPTSVTAIGSNAFNGSSIISVTIPSNVNTIGDSAFRKCANLSSVTVSDGVKAIEQNAFRACNSLKTIALPASIEKVGAAAFFECTDLISATFAPSDKQVALGDNLFSKCDYLMGVTLPKYANQMGAGMFMNCRRLSGVEIPKGIESIGESTFASCSGFTTVIIPDSVTRIERSAFQGTALNNIYFAGTEAQWNSMWISPDLTNIVSNAVKHYNYTTDIATAKVTLEKSEYNYDGTEKTPAVTVELNDKKLVLNTDYTVSYKDNIRPGTATVTVTGKAWYTGSQTKTFTITGGDENNNGGGTNGSGSDGNGNGSGDNTGNSDNPGGSGGNSGGGGNTGGTGGNTGGGSSVSRGNLSKATIKLSQTSYTYDGKAKTPAATVVLNGKTLVSSTDYTVSYSDNIKVGTAKVTVTGKGNYTGSKTATFTITKASNQAATSIICKKTVYKVAYGTKPFKINASSKGKMAFTSSKPKIASVKKGTGVVTIKNTGIATITIKAGNVSKKVTIKVSPKKQSVKSVKAVKGKKLTVKWAKDKMASGYQVQVSTDKKFKKNVKSKSLSKTSYTFTKLKAGRKYYVRIRSFKKSGKETLNGSWSKVKLSSKVKK